MKLASQVKLTVSPMVGVALFLVRSTQLVDGLGLGLGDGGSVVKEIIGAA